MRLLIAGSPSKFFHLQEFSNALIKNGIDCKLVKDIEFSDRFPSRKILHWFSNKKKFSRLIAGF